MIESKGHKLQIARKIEEIEKHIKIYQNELPQFTGDDLKEHEQEIADLKYLRSGLKGVLNHISVTTANHHEYYTPGDLERTKAEIFDIMEKGLMGQNHDIFLEDFSMFIGYALNHPLYAKRRDPALYWTDMHDLLQVRELLNCVHTFYKCQKNLKSDRNEIQ